jgi:hypothetical protein
MLDWRDRALDLWAPHISEQAVKFLKAAREIEEGEGAGGQYRLAAWTSERLPETLRRRQESSLLDVRDRWWTITADLRRQLRDDQTEGRTRRLDEWVPVIESHERRILEAFPAARRLTPAERQLVVSQTGKKVRPPRAMALHLLWLTWGVHRYRNDLHPMKAFEHDLRRVPRRPRAL